MTRLAKSNIKILLGLALACLSSMHYIAGAQEKDSYFLGGHLFIINSSHQDIAWMDEPEACVRFRDEHMITPALRRMSESSDFCFSVEDALSLKEYLERHPDRYDEILKYTKEGRLEWGATYKQPYQSMHDGEALVRQAYFGRKWLKKTLPGCEFTTAWNEDVPGMALQFPQIMSKAGIPYYQFSRHQPGYYKWSSPDGSSILCWTPGQYECVGRPIRNAGSESERTEAFKQMLDSWDGYFRDRKILPGLPFIYSYDFSTPLDYDDYIKDWNDGVSAGNNDSLPYIHYATNRMAMDYVSQGKKTEFEELMGERPNVWLYIHGPAHHKAVSACRKASRVLTAAEKFSTFNALLANTFCGYPAAELETAWEGVVFPDHGWGGNKGVVTDRLFREKYETALSLGNKVLEDAVSSISDRISYRKDAFKAVTVFNSLSWDRSDPVQFSVCVEGRDANRFKLIDADGNDVPLQIIPAGGCIGGSDEVLTFSFVAKDVPAMGYRTFYLVESDFCPVFESVKMDGAYENPFYRISFCQGGIESLYDKELSREYIKADKFNAAELFSMRSVGNGAGEFTDVQQPDMEGFDRLGNYVQSWQCIEAGPVYDMFQLIQPMRNARAAVRIRAYKTIKRIDVETDLDGFNGENWREFRLAFPINMDEAKVSYEVPFGVVEVGKDEIDGAAGFSKPEQIYSTPCRNVHPREVQDWFSASDGTCGITISSDVAVFDWIDPTDAPVDYPVLQPVLLASRKSCHDQGNYYLQPGNHSYVFSLFTHESDWKNGYKVATQAKQPLLAVVRNPVLSSGDMPDTFRFAELAGNGVIVSTIKKCDDDDSVIMRCYDIEGADTELEFRMFRPFSNAMHTDIIEERPSEIKLKSGALKLGMGHHSIETFKFDICR